MGRLLNFTRISELTISQILMKYLVRLCFIAFIGFVPLFVISTYYGIVKKNHNEYKSKSIGSHYLLQEDGTLLKLDPTKYVKNNFASSFLYSLDRTDSIAFRQNMISGTLDVQFQLFDSEISDVNYAFDVFKFLSENSNVEFGLDIFYDENDSTMKSVLSTSKDKYQNKKQEYAILGYLNKEGFCLLSSIHSHPEIKGVDVSPPTGFYTNGKVATFTGDVLHYKMLSTFTKKMPSMLYLYDKNSKKLFSYNDRLFKVVENFKVDNNLTTDSLRYAQIRDNLYSEMAKTLASLRIELDERYKDL